MERRESNHVAQKIAIPGLLDCSILAADGRDSTPTIPYPDIVARIEFLQKMNITKGLILGYGIGSVFASRNLTPPVS